MQPLVESVPNFSEGRDLSVIEQIVSAMKRTPGLCVLDRTSDADHNRSVITVAGSPEAVGEAAVAAAGVAVERIDLRLHRGVHPRVGALDVLPFVPLEGITLAECAELAEATARRIWERWRIPSYLYEAAARLPERRNLANVRLTSAGAPDVGGPDPHPTAGVMACGARKFLIAFNVNLGTGDLAIARRIASAVRESSGGLRCVKALGLTLESRGIAQVSMNLTDFDVTPLHVAFQAVEAEASRAGVEVAESELIGLVPLRAWEMSSGFDLRVRGWSDSMILENRLAAACPR